MTGELMHWQVLNPAGAACGANGGVVTLDPAAVTCDACKNTRKDTP